MIEYLKSLLTPERMRFVKFCFVGGSGVFVNLFFTWLGYEIFFKWAGEDFKKALAGLFGIIISIFTNFVLNDLWTWKDSEKRGILHFFIRMAKFYLVSAIAALIQYGIYLGLSTQFGVHYLLSQLIGIAVATPINYIVNNLWTFKRVKGQGARDKGKKERQNLF